jgi:hypothetical protein
VRNFPLLKTPRRQREWETSEISKAPSQPIGWNPGRGQWKMITDNSKTQTSEPNSNKTEKRNSYKDQRVSEKSLDDLESIQMEDEVKNILMTIINLVINSGDAKAVESRRASRTILQQKFNWNEPIKTVQWNCRSLRSKFPEFEQRSQNIDIIILSET